MQVADYLRTKPLFADLTEGEMLDVLRLAKVVRWKAGDALCRAGDPATCMYLLEKGSVSVRVRRPDGTPVEVKVLGAGEVIGELALVDSQPRSADLVALDEVQAYALDRVEFDRLRAQLNPAAFKMLRHVALVVSARLRDLNTFAVGGIESVPRTEAREVRADAASAGWRNWLTVLRGGVKRVDP